MAACSRSSSASGTPASGGSAIASARVHVAGARAAAGSRCLAASTATAPTASPTTAATTGIGSRRRRGGARRRRTSAPRSPRGSACGATVRSAARLRAPRGRAELHGREAADERAAAAGVLDDVVGDSPQRLVEGRVRPGGRRLARWLLEGAHRVLVRRWDEPGLAQAGCPASPGRRVRRCSCPMRRSSANRDRCSARPPRAARRGRTSRRRQRRRRGGGGSGRRPRPTGRRLP